MATKTDPLEALEARRADLLASLEALDAARTAFEPELARLQAAAVLDGTPEATSAAEDAENHARDLDAQQARTRAALAALEQQIAEARQAQEQAERAALEARFEAIRGEARKLATKLEKRVTDFEGWRTLAALREEQLAIADQLRPDPGSALPVTTPGHPMADKIIAAPEQALTAWVNALRWHLFDGLEPQTEDDRRALEQKRGRWTAPSIRLADAVVKD